MRQKKRTEILLKVFKIDNLDKGVVFEFETKDLVALVMNLKPDQIELKQDYTKFMIDFFVRNLKFCRFRFLS